MMKKIVIGVVVGLLLALIAGTVTWGLITDWRFACHIDIQPGVGISVYDDAEFTTYRTGFDFYSPIRESSVHRDYFVKNTSLDILTVSANSTLDGIDVNLWLYTEPLDLHTPPAIIVPYRESFTLIPDQWWYVWMEVYIPHDAPLGQHDFDIYLNTVVAE